MLNEGDLLSANMGLVMYHVSKMRPTRVADLDDFKQAGTIGLLKAIRGYDPSKGKLSTYAWRKIKQEIMREALRFSESPSTLAFEPLMEEADKFWEYMPDMDQESMQIIGLRAIGHTLQEIADMYGRSKQWVKFKVDDIIKLMKETNCES